MKDNKKILFLIFYIWKHICEFREGILLINKSYYQRYGNKSLNMLTLQNLSIW